MTRHALILLALVTLTGCHTVSLPPVNLAEPGWQTRQGQAVWKPNHQAPEIAGELLIATHADGSSFIQFTKNPFPFVVARTAVDSWQIEFTAANRSYAGRGRPPQRLIWFQLGPFLKHEPLAKTYSMTNLDAQHWRLESQATGETLEGYFNP